MRFTSDSIATQHRYVKCEQIIKQVESQLPNYKNFVYDTTRFTYTIGGMIIFPKLRGSMNQDRDTNPMIADRWDLSLNYLLISRDMLSFSFCRIFLIKTEM